MEIVMTKSNYSQSKKFKIDLIVWKYLSTRVPLPFGKRLK